MESIEVASCSFSRLLPLPLSSPSRLGSKLTVKTFETHLMDRIKLAKTFCLNAKPYQPTSVGSKALLITLIRRQSDVPTRPKSEFFVCFSLTATYSRTHEQLRKVLRVLLSIFSLTLLSSSFIAQRSECKKTLTSVA